MIKGWSSVLLLSLATSLAAQRPGGAQPSIRRIPLRDVPVSAHIPLPGSPDWMAVGFGSLWVVNYKPNRVSRVDPTTGKVLAEVSLEGKACLGIAMTRDRVWVPTCGTVAINEIDPATNRLVQRFPVPVSVDSEGSFAAGDESLWLPVRGRDSTSAAIARIDGHSGAVQHLIAVPRGSAALVDGFGALWVASSAHQRDHRVDTARNRVIARIPSVRRQSSWRSATALSGCRIAAMAQSPASTRKRTAKWRASKHTHPPHTATSPWATVPSGWPSTRRP